MLAAGPTPPQATSVAPSTSVTAAPAAPAPIIATRSSNPVTRYLRETYPIYFDLIARAWATYGTAYQHCLIERYGMRICREAGIGLTARVITPGHTPTGEEIRPKDVAVAAAVPESTFATIRTEFGKVRDARLLLQRWRDHVARNGPVAGVSTENVTKFQMLLPLLEVMIEDEIIDAAYLTDPSLGGDRADAAGLAIGEFMGRVEGALQVLRAVIA